MVIIATMKFLMVLVLMFRMASAAHRSRWGFFLFSTVDWHE
jgi:hypothetical protein